MVRHEAAEAMGATPLVQSVPTLKDFLVDERREVRETCEIALSGRIWKKARQKRRNLKRRTRGSTTIRLLPLLVDLFLFCRQFISEDPTPALPSSLLRPSSRSSTSYIDADISTLTKNPPRSVSFPVHQIPGLFTSRNISALRPRSTRSLQPRSRRMKSVHPSLTLRSLFALARCRTPINRPGVAQGP